MSSAKIEVADMLAKLPDDSSFEDIQYHLYVLEKIHRGVVRANDEGEIPHSDAKERLKKWLD